MEPRRIGRLDYWGQNANIWLHVVISDLLTSKEHGTPCSPEPVLKTENCWYILVFLIRMHQYQYWYQALNQPHAYLLTLNLIQMHCYQHPIPADIMRCKPSVRCRPNEQMNSNWQWTRVCSHMLLILWWSDTKSLITLNILLWHIPSRHTLGF